MAKNSWLGSAHHQAITRRVGPRRRASAPRCESLETRTLMATRVWGAAASLWSDPNSWTPTGTPMAGDTLVFDDSGNRSSQNDLTNGTMFDLQITASGYTLFGNSVGIAGPSAVTASYGADNSVIDLALQLGGDATATVDTATLIVGRILGGVGGHTLTKAGAGSMIFAGFSHTNFVTHITSGTAQVDGGIGGVLLDGGTIQGAGTVSSIFAASGGGVVSPGDSPGILASGSVGFNPATTFAVEINGTSVGTEYDQLDVTGTVLLDGKLTIALGFAPGQTDSFTIINNDGTDPVFGTFTGLPQGATITINSTQFLINYAGGDGNDVVLAVNGAPVARDDVYSLPAESTLFVPPTGVLLNDSPDPNGDTIVPVLVASPMHGTLRLYNDGSFDYTPAPGFSGVDTFTYYDTDGNLNSNTATVTLFVNVTNLPPVVRDDSYTATADTLLTIAAPGVLGNDYSPQGGPLTAELLAGATSGVVMLNADGSFTYMPAAGFVGTDSFTYRARDASGLGSSDNPAATVFINVGALNVAPVAVDDAFSVAEDKTLIVAGPGVLYNDTDANAVPFPDTISAFLVNGPLHGSLDLSSTGQFVYTPDPNYFGTDSFQYRATDGQLFSNLATVTITINPVNDPPVGTDDQYVMNQGTTLTIASPGVLANDTDLDPGATLTAVLINGPQRATSFMLNANGSFTYTPQPGFFGTDTFTYKASDGNPGGLSELTTVTITIEPVNVPPVAVNDTYTTNEDRPLSVSGPGVLLNDTDPNGDFLSAVLATAPLHGTVQLNSDGSFLYTPDANYFGSDTFTYNVSDGKLFSPTPGTVTITVRQVPEPPVAANDTYTVMANQKLSVVAPGILANDFDVDSPTLTAVLVNPPLNGTLVIGADGSFLYTPNLGYSGADSFTYRASDGTQLSNLATVTITVMPVAAMTAMLDPASDTGASNTDRVTNDNTPTFLGTASPNLIVQLTIQGLTGGTPQNLVISGSVDAAGNYAITAPPLPDGNYVFSLTSTRGDGINSGPISAGPLTIDTVGPRVSSAFINPRTGQIYVAFQDDRSGMNAVSMNNLRNYTFTRRTAPNPRQFNLTAARVQPSAGLTDPQTVVLTSRNGHVIPHGRYQFAITASGITDVAGNILDGEFNGTLPSGNGTQGGNFTAQFLNGNQSRQGPTPFSQFVPVLTRTKKATTPHKAQRPRVANAVKTARPRHPSGPVNRSNLFS